MFGAEKRILAFGGAPRSAIINGVLCRRVFCFNFSRWQSAHLSVRGSTLESSSVFETKNKPSILQWIDGLFGAEKRIRTSGKLSTYTRFPIVLLKPLRHLCTFLQQPIYITVFFGKLQAFLFAFCKNVKNNFISQFSRRFTYGRVIETLVHFKVTSVRFLIFITVARRSVFQKSRIRAFCAGKRRG